jgi:type IV secretion system protein VirD4
MFNRIFDLVWQAIQVFFKWVVWAIRFIADSILKLVFWGGGAAIGAGAGMTICALYRIFFGMPTAGHLVFYSIVALCGLAGAFVGWFILSAWTNNPDLPVLSTALGSARFLGQDEIRPMLGKKQGFRGDKVKPTGIIIGRENSDTGGLVYYDGPAHLLTIAPTRSGKGIGAVIPNLLKLQRSVICIDPKGENVKATLAARQAIGPVHVLDPFGITGVASASYNPLTLLDPNSPDLIEDATTLADALVVDPADQVRDAHWNEEAKALITGMIMFCVTCEKPEARTLETVREYLTLPPDKFSSLLSLMAARPEVRGLIARAANRQLGKSDREAAGVLSTAQRHTHILDSSRMVNLLNKSSFKFDELKSGVATVFLVLPPDRLHSFARWLRLMLSQALLEISRSGQTNSPPILFLLDEFAALGHLSTIENAMGLMAGYGVQLWPILQDLNQLEALYGRRAGSFISNAGVLQTFGTNDFKTAQWISDMLGDITVDKQHPWQHELQMAGMDVADMSQHLGPSYGGQEYVARKLMTADEVRVLHDQLMIVFIQGLRPALFRKIRYFEDAEFDRIKS